MKTRFDVMAFLLVLFAAPALASDGILEINQTCAVETGCFTGDMPGFPVTISSTGSYRLTGSLRLIDPNTTAILISANHVSLDLRGFGIRCTEFIPPATVQFCAVTGGTGRGVDVDDPLTRSGVEVRNGSVAGMGSDGVSVGIEGAVRSLRTVENGDTGIRAGSGSIVTSNLSARNRLNGIAIGAGGLVERNTIRANLNRGLEVGPDAGYRGNVFDDNFVDRAGNFISSNLGGNLCSGSICN